MRFDWQPKPTVAFKELESICPVGEYCVVNPQDVPQGIVSPGLLAKAHSVLVLCSGTSTGRVYTMMNINRIDRDEIDQMPYGIAFDGNEPIPSGVLIQHGDYPGRTIPLPLDFYEFISASGTYPLNGMPPNDHGPISELNIGSQDEAFRLLVTHIESHFPEGEE